MRPFACLQASVAVFKKLDDPRLKAVRQEQLENTSSVWHTEPVRLAPGIFFTAEICLNRTTCRRRKEEVCPTAPSGAVGMHIKPDLPCENQITVSEQTTTSHKGHQGVNRLTRSCQGRWKKHRTKYKYDANCIWRRGLQFAGNGSPPSL
jgi:hypothetical protein